MKNDDKRREDDFPSARQVPVSDSRSAFGSARLSAAGELTSQHQPDGQAAVRHILNATCVRQQIAQGGSVPLLASTLAVGSSNVGVEVGGLGGRFGAEAAAFLRKLAAAKAREVPARLRSAARQASLHRWTGLWQSLRSGRLPTHCRNSHQC